MRGLTPLGLNVCEMFYPVSQVMRMPSLIGPAMSPMEKEVRYVTNVTLFFSTVHQLRHLQGQYVLACL